MLNKPEASTTANTKIDSVYKRIKELTHVESLSPFTENKHLFMTAVSLTDESLEIKRSGRKHAITYPWRKWVLCSDWQISSSTNH